MFIFAMSLSMLSSIASLFIPSGEFGLNIFALMFFLCAIIGAYENVRRIGSYGK